MVGIKQLKEFHAQLLGERDARRRRREAEVRLLPADITGQVVYRCRQEAARIRDRLEKVDEAIEETEAELEAAEAEVREAYTPIYRERRLRGDILGEYRIEPAEPRSGQFMRTKEAIALKKEKVDPLRERLESLQLEVHGRQQELSELRKIATMAAAGEVALVHFLSDKWRSRLEIGHGVEGVPAKVSGRVIAVTDMMGYKLPAEAVEDDAASMDMGGRRVEWSEG